MTLSYRKKPILSLVTINYNGADFLEKCIESVISQATEDIEYFIVDGGSSDNSLEIIRKYEGLLSGWISEQDSGPAEAINKGLHWSNGIWFNWLNSDDYLLPGSINNLLENLKLAAESEWITCTRLIQHEDGFIEQSGLWYKHWHKYAIGEADFAQDATFIKRNILNEIGGLNTSCQSCFDRELYLRMLRRGLPIFSTLPFSVFRRLPTQLSLRAS
jgi:glycosyltransferase involved in cell wall biosynthesis